MPDPYIPALASDVTAREARKVKNGKTEYYSSSSNDSTSRDITYYKDGKLYTITESADGKDGSYTQIAESEIDEYISRSYGDITVTADQLREATVKRDGNKLTIKAKVSDDDAAELIDGYTGEMAMLLTDADLSVSDTDYTFIFENGKIKSLTVGTTITMKMDLSTLGAGITGTMTMKFDITLKATVNAYGKADDIKITPPSGLDNYPKAE